MKAKLQKWWEIYPAGTKTGDEEKKFFVALARNPQYTYRSIGAIAQETGLTKTRCEEIVNKYYNKGMVVQNSKNPDQWAYWENLGIDPNINNAPGIVDSDKSDRIKKVKK